MAEITPEGKVKALEDELQQVKKVLQQRINGKDASSCQGTIVEKSKSKSKSKSKKELVRDITTVDELNLFIANDFIASINNMSKDTLANIIEKNPVVAEQEGPFAKYYIEKLKNGMRNRGEVTKTFKTNFDRVIGLFQKVLNRALARKL